jgi:hypothetical protein
MVPIPSSGDVSQILPAAIGSDASKPPVLVCYTSSTGTNAWLLVTDGFSTASSWCAMSLVSGAWVASFHDGIPGWFAAFSVIY